MSRSTIRSLLVCLLFAAASEGLPTPCHAADAAYSTFPTYPTTYGIYWSGYGDPYPAFYGWYGSGYYYPYSFGWFTYPYPYASWYVYPYAWPYAWAGWYSGPYLYPFRPYYSWFHPVVYYPGAYMFPTPIGYPLVLAAPAEPKKETETDDVASRNLVARKQGSVPAPDQLLRGKTRGDAPALYAQGLEEFRDGRFARAQAYLEAATTLDDADPRGWYFLALACWKQGDETAGDDAAKYGAAVQVNGQFDRSVVARSLESVQGTLRYRIEGAMLNTDKAKAATFLAAKRNDRPKATGVASATVPSNTAP